MTDNARWSYRVSLDTVDVMGELPRCRNSIIFLKGQAFAYKCSKRFFSRTGGGLPCPRPSLFLPSAIRLRPEVWTSGLLDVRTSGRPDVCRRTPDAQTSRRPDVGTSRRPDVWTSGRADVRTSGRSRIAEGGRNVEGALGLAGAPAGLREKSFTTLLGKGLALKKRKFPRNEAAVPKKWLPKFMLHGHSTKAEIDTGYEWEVELENVKKTK